MWEHSMGPESIVYALEVVRELFYNSNWLLFEVWNGSVLCQSVLLNISNVKFDSSAILWALSVMEARAGHWYLYAAEDLDIWL